MKVAVFQKPGIPLVIEDRPDPGPGPNDVVLKIDRCGICGSDLHMTDGTGITATSGTILGHEFSGEVVATGSRISKLKIGDCVTAQPFAGCGNCESCRHGEPQWCSSGIIWRAGGYAEYALASESGCIKLPHGVSLTDGALVEPLAVALNAVRQAGSLEGKRVIVIGPGPIGLGVVYWAKRSGAERIVMISRSTLREDLSLHMGATDFLVNGEAIARSCVAKLGGGADVVFECVGSPGMISAAIDLVRARGTVLVAGYCLQQDTFMPAVAVTKQIRIQFAVLYGIAEFQRCVDALDAGFVEPRAMISDTVGFDTFPKTFEELRQSRDKCKVLLAPWQVEGLK